MNVDVAGYCPMGCGQTLFVGTGGYITCSFADCPRPTAVVSLLNDPESDHIVTFGQASFTVRHPLRERLDGDLEDCQLTKYLTEWTGPPVRLGIYRAIKELDSPLRWRWVALK